MKHLGNITLIHGNEIEPVDCIIGGSPCQDLSVAGKRAGLSGERSGLFMEQIRIAKEMRKRYGKPRYMVWENVPGAFSSNSGEDFRAVLEEVTRIADETAVIPRPPKGEWSYAGCIMGDGWSVAWRTHDAQFWGVPQRRRRIALVADFGGESAPEILFERESVSGNTESGGETREGTAASLENSTGSTVWCLQGNGIDRADTAGCNGRGWRENVSYTLNTIDRPAVYAGVSYKIGAKAGSIGYELDRPPTLAANHNDAAVCYDMTHANDVIRDCGHICPTLQGRMGTGGNQIPICIGNGQADQLRMSDKVGALNCMHDQQAIICIDRAAFNQSENACYDINISDDGIAPTQVAKSPSAICADVDCRNGTENSDVNGTLQVKSTGGQSLNLNNVVRYRYTVRRLTPLECERLQGYPEIIKADIENMSKDEFIALNLASGQIIADCKNGKVYTTKGPGGIALAKPKELAGTIVNGYRVVSIRNGAVKKQCRVHRVIWIAQNGVIPEGMVVDHINNDKLDNRIENLQLLTPEDNSSKASNDGLYLSGDENPASVISEQARIEIALWYQTGEFTIRQLAEKYGISKSRVHQIVKAHGWTDIGDWIDTKGKKHKSADAPRYKALGNSIALPFWLWMLRRMRGYLPTGATMGSLFDGIGGFPLCWETIHGRGSARWASEIEEFPIAVTKLRFPEEEE